jgi:hypothetical protein
MKTAPDVSDMLVLLLQGVRRELGDNLTGVYLRGSLVTGDLDPATSDIDLLAVTERPVSEWEFVGLGELHDRLAKAQNPYAREVEIAYIDRTALRRFQPGLRHPTLGRGETLAWTEHRDNWILERWVVRERGVALLGPDPRTLIDPVSAEALRAAVRTRLRDWSDWADAPDDPAWLERRGAQAYTVETICRALHTLATGTLESKPRAVAWAIEALPAPWRNLVQRVRIGRTDDACDPAPVPDVLRFVKWAASEGEAVVKADHRPEASRLLEAI